MFIPFGPLCWLDGWEFMRFFVFVLWVVKPDLSGTRLFFCYSKTGGWGLLLFSGICMAQVVSMGGYCFSSFFYYEHDDGLYTQEGQLQILLALRILAIKSKKARTAQGTGLYWDT